MGVRMAAPELGDQGRRVGAGGQGEAVIAGERSRQDDLGARQVGQADHHARPDRLEAAR